MIKTIAELIFLAGVTFGAFLFLINVIIYLVEASIERREFKRKLDEDLRRHEEEDQLKPETKEILKEIIIKGRRQKKWGR